MLFNGRSAKMKSIHVVLLVSLLIVAAAPCFAQRASTLHVGITPSTLYVGITPSTLHVGITPSTLHVGITPSTLYIGINPSTLHVGMTPSTLHIGIELSTSDMSGAIYPPLVSVIPVLQSYDLTQEGIQVVKRVDSISDNSR
jgi:hypothetical protein